MVLVAPRSAKLVESRGARFTLLAGYVFAVLAFVWMLLLWSEDAPYWQIGLAYAFIGIGVGLRRHPGLALAHRVGARAARRHGVGHRRPAARPGRRDHAVDLRRPADRRLRLGGRDRHRRLAEQQARSATASRAELTKSFAGADDIAAAIPAVLRPDHRRRQAPRSCTATTGPTPPASSPCSSEPPWSGSAFPGAARSNACSPATTPRTQASRRPRRRRPNRTRTDAATALGSPTLPARRRLLWRLRRDRPRQRRGRHPVRRQRPPPPRPSPSSCGGRGSSSPSSRSRAPAG